MLSAPLGPAMNRSQKSATGPDATSGVLVLLRVLRTFPNLDTVSHPDGDLGRRLSFSSRLQLIQGLIQSLAM